MGTVTNINGIDVEKKGELTIRAVAWIMAVSVAKANGLGPEWADANYKANFEGAQLIIDNAEAFNKVVHDQS